MSSVLSSVTGTDDEAEAKQDTEEATTDGSGSGSRRRNLGIAAAGLGVAYFLRRLSRKRGRDDDGATTATTDADESTADAADSEEGRRFGGRLSRAVAGIAASVLVRRALRRWRKQ